MEAYLLDWANLLLRWLLVITAIAWVGSSFYFVWLDNNLMPPVDEDLRRRGVDGELWAVHGGGFYNPQKYFVGPRRLPQAPLHWFYWESYSTWLSGFGLLAVLYLWHAQALLVDPRVHAWSPAAAVAGALGLLVGFWLVYDAICRVAGTGPKADRIVAVLVSLLVAAAAWLAAQLFAGRAALLLAGAAIATTMSANVLFCIIPGQRKVVAALQAGAPVDPVHGQRGKQRSVHNTYFTLPVLAAMLSNHYGALTSHRFNWLALLVLMAAGALIRHSFVARHKARLAGKPAPWGWAAAGGLLIVGLSMLGARELPAPLSPRDAPSFAQVQAVVQQRCVPCHNAQLVQKGVSLHEPALIQRHASAVYQQAVLQRTMPLNNATGMTDEERELIRGWFEAGAPGPTAER